MTQPPDAVVILHRAAACQKEDFYPPGMEKVSDGCQDKKRVFEENVKSYAATARRVMGVPLWNRRR